MKVIEISSPNAKFDLQLAELMLHHVCGITSEAGDVSDVLVTVVEGQGLIRLHGWRVHFDPASVLSDYYTVTNRPFEIAMIDIARVEVLT